MNWIERLGGEEAVIRGITGVFRALNHPPHPSWHEGEISRALAGRLEELGLAVRRDEFHNLAADVPPAPGREGAPLVILQGHLDMVCAAAPGSGYDPARDSVAVTEREGFLRSDGRSSLGADNNLGNAAVLWLLGQGVPHGPLRLLFTVAEEVGLEGAKRVDPAWLAGAKYLINTDGFHLGRMVVSSAGGRRETFSRPLSLLPAPAGEGYALTLSGCAGGHSGDDIHRGRCNSVQALARFLAGLELPFALAELEGGTAHNAIPSSCRAVLVTGEGEALRCAAEGLRGALEHSHRDTDPGLTLSLEPVPAPARVWDPACARDALALLAGLTHGVVSWQEEFPGVPAASANLGRVWTEEGAVHAAAFLRCVQGEEEAALAARHRSLAEALGFSVHTTGYPGWAGSASNPLAVQMAEVFRRETGRTAEIAAVHVGLEPSIFQAKAPGLIMVSTGPDILDAHAVTERAPLASLPPYAALLAGTLEVLSAGGPPRRGE